MLKNAIERAKNEQAESVKVCLELKQGTYDEIKQNAEENSVTVENICKSIIELNVEKEEHSSNIENAQQEEINVWIISSKYRDAEQDFTQKCLDNSQIRIGWYQAGFTTLPKAEQNGIIAKKESNAQTALGYFFNSMKEGDLVVMKEGKSKIHAIVQINSSCAEDEEGFFYREIKKILVVPQHASHKVAELYIQYFKKGLNITTLYKKSITKIDFLSFMLNASIESSR
ncbi:MAG: hypothetical protein U9N49_01455 [Campylobacterota bacterium]|nr:hypothetical protein [Campylobacterota bacterium]